MLPPTFVAPEGVDMKVWAFSADDWKKLEPEGCVFLPDAGIRAGLEYNGFSPTRVCCWTTTPYTDSYGYALTADGDALIEITMAARHFGMSVRLVEDVE